MSSGPAHEPDCAISQVGARHGCTCASSEPKLPDVRRPIGDKAAWKKWGIGWFNYAQHVEKQRDDIKKEFSEWVDECGDFQERLADLQEAVEKFTGGAKTHPDAGKQWNALIEALRASKGG